MKANMDALLPEDLKNDTTYASIMGVVDKQMSKLSDTVMKFKKKMTESNVCMKQHKTQKNQRPTGCPSGYKYDGKSHCLKLDTCDCKHFNADGSGCQQPDGIR